MLFLGKSNLKGVSRREIVTFLTFKLRVGIGVNQLKFEDWTSFELIQTNLTKIC